MNKIVGAGLITIALLMASCSGGGNGAAKNSPNAPENLNATALSENLIELTWKDQSEDEDGFTIEQSLVSSTEGFEEIANIGANVTQLDVTELSASTTYYFRVLAYNSGGDSGYSNVANTTTFEAPPLIPVSPANLLVSDKSSTTISLAWEDRADNESQIIVEHAGYDTVNEICEIFSELAVLAADVTSYIHHDLQPHSQHCYRVVAINDAGESEYSNVIVNEMTLGQLTLTINLNAYPTGLVGDVEVYEGANTTPSHQCEKLDTDTPPVVCEFIVDEGTDLSLRVNYFDVIYWGSPCTNTYGNTCEFTIRFDMEVGITLSVGA